MADMGVDITGRAAVSRSTTHASTATVRSDDNVMDMDMFLQLLAAQLQNQDVMNPTSETEYMNQMAQMATVQAMNTMTDVSLQTYSASLVGKDVTVAAVDKDGNIEEIFGTVTATGLYGGEHVIFIDDESYYLSQIMAIGKLPPPEDTEGGEDSGDTESGTETPPVEGDA